MAKSKGDKKAQKARAKSKSDKPSRRPKQKGKVKKALNARPTKTFHMRTELPASMKREVEADRLQDNGVSPAVARNVAAWRAQRKVL
jgi:hypothetical protein